MSREEWYFEIFIWVGEKYFNSTRATFYDAEEQRKWRNSFVSFSPYPKAALFTYILRLFSSHFFILHVILFVSIYFKSFLLAHTQCRSSIGAPQNIFDDEEDIRRRLATRVFYNDDDREDYEENEEDEYHDKVSDLVCRYRKKFGTNCIFIDFINAISSLLLKYYQEEALKMLKFAEKDDGSVRWSSHSASYGGTHSINDCISRYSFISAFILLKKFLLY